MGLILGQLVRILLDVLWCTVVCCSVFYAMPRTGSTPRTTKLASQPVGTCSASIHQQAFNIVVAVMMQTPWYDVCDGCTRLGVRV